MSEHDSTTNTLGSTLPNIDVQDQLPPGFKVLGKAQNSPIAIIGDEARKFYAMQFHPEVVHTPDGAKLILRPRRKLLWLGKGLVRAAAELGDDGADARYVVVLADNKADERFKKRLTQNADSPPCFCRLFPLANRYRR